MEKTYLIPKIKVVELKLHLMRDFSGQGTDGMKISEEYDNSESTVTNRSRQGMIWDNEDADW